VTDQDKSAKETYLDAKETYLDAKETYLDYEEDVREDMTDQDKSCDDHGASQVIVALVSVS